MCRPLAAVDDGVPQGDDVQVTLRHRISVAPISADDMALRLGGVFGPFGSGSGRRFTPKMLLPSAADPIVAARTPTLPETGAMAMGVTSVTRSTGGIPLRVGSRWLKGCRSAHVAHPSHPFDAPQTSPIGRLEQSELARSAPFQSLRRRFKDIGSFGDEARLRTHLARARR